jgi:ABC-type amino acid transport substrate-binding protein
LSGGGKRPLGLRRTHHRHTDARGPLAAQIRRDYPQVKLLTVDSYDAALDTVLDGQADVAALNFQVGQQLVRRKYPGKLVLPEQPYTKLPFAFAVANGRQAELLQRFDRSLAALRQDGTIDHLVDQWMRG